MAKIKSYNKIGFGKFLVMALVLGGGLIYGTQMVQKNQENRSKATEVTTPTKTYCNNGVVSLLLDTPCVGNDFRYMTYKCQDGYSFREGTDSSCKPVSLWMQYAKDSCFFHSKCIEKTIPTPTPSPIVTKTVTPTPILVSDTYIKQDTQCLSIGGKCQKTTTACNGSYLTGYCPSSGSDIKCCKQPTTVTKICSPGTKQCSGNKLQSCNSLGTVWMEISNCLNGCNETTKTCNATPDSTLPSLGQKCGNAGFCIKTTVPLTTGTACTVNGLAGKIKTGLCSGDSTIRCCDAN